MIDCTGQPKRTSCKSTIDKCPIFNNNNYINLKEIVNAYKKHVEKSYKNYLDFYKGGSIEKAIQKATNSILADNKMSHHQRRIGKTLLEKWKLKLISKKQEIKVCDSFIELYDLIKEYSQGNQIERIGQLCVYDTSLRLSSFLELEVDKVHLQCGALRGAKNLGLKVKQGILIDVPIVFSSLSCPDIENLLCVFKDKFNLDVLNSKEQ